MKRRHAIQATAVGLLGLATTFRLVAGDDDPTAKAPSKTNVDRVEMTMEEWKKLLPQERYDILFRDKTERAGSSPLDAEKRAGTFICAACYQPLFSSADKFDSGTGWPSFTQPINEQAIDTKKDYKLIWPRTEYHCSRCDGHQGHVFDDGPQPTGQRWCNNGLALEFVVDGDPLPELRG